MTLLLMCQVYSQNSMKLVCSSKEICQRHISYLQLSFQIVFSETQPVMNSTDQKHIRWWLSTVLFTPEGVAMKHVWEISGSFNTELVINPLLDVNSEGTGVAEGEIVLIQNDMELRPKCEISFQDFLYKATQSPCFFPSKKTDWKLLNVGSTTT